jgi:lipopolysaccharide biosynthesis protein
MGPNQALVDEISLEIGIPFIRGKFAAGTMFWVDPRAIEPILKLQVNDFDIERGLADGTRAHAIERLFCVVCEAKGFEVSTVG